METRDKVRRIGLKDILGYVHFFMDIHLTIETKLKDALNNQCIVVYLSGMT